MPFKALNFSILPSQISGVLTINVERERHLFRKFAVIIRRCAARGNRGTFALKEMPARIVDESHLTTDRRQPLIRVVLTQAEAIFRTTRKHPIRLWRSTCHQIINHDANVRL